MTTDETTPSERHDDMSETCKARYVVAGDDDKDERDMLVQCQDGAMETHPREAWNPPEAGGLLHHAWTAHGGAVEWLDRWSQPEAEITTVAAGEHAHECGHTDADHAAGEGAGNGLEGLLRAIFGGGHVPASFTTDPGKIRVPEPEPTPDPLAMLLGGLEQMKDAHAAVLGAAAEHRDRATSAGFSETAAEGMAIMFYMQAFGR